MHVFIDTYRITVAFFLHGDSYDILTVDMNIAGRIALGKGDLRYVGQMNHAAGRKSYRCLADFCQRAVFSVDSD